MPKRRRAPDLNDLIDSAVDTAVGGLFDRAETFVERIRQQPTPTVRLPGEPQRSVYVCAACRRSFARDQMEMIHPKNEFGVCQRCFGFMWTATEEKAKALAAAAAKRRIADQARQATPPVTPRRPPWEVLEIHQDASIDEIKKAFKRLAMLYHPDRLPASASTEERESTKMKFEEIMRAQKVMLAVRSAPES